MFDLSQHTPLNSSEMVFVSSFYYNLLLDDSIYVLSPKYSLTLDPKFQQYHKGGKRIC